jgi:hypothetical protein
MAWNTVRSSAINSVGRKSLYRGFSEVTVPSRRNSGDDHKGGPALPLSLFFIDLSFVCRVTSIPPNLPSGLFLEAIGA